MLTYPAHTLIEAVRQRNSRETFAARMLLWLFVAAVGVPLVASLFYVASAPFG